MDKNKSNPWTPSEDLVAQQLAWGSSIGPSQAAETTKDGWAHSTQAMDKNESTATTGPKSGRPGDSDELELNAIVGSGTSFHGTLSFSGRVRIEGEFAGQILGGRLLVIGGGARVQGEIRAERVIILGGNVKADILATESIELYVPAQVAGDLQAPEIHMDRGVKFQGTCDLSEPSQF